MLPIWGTCGITRMRKIQTVQNRCIKSILRVPRDTSTTYLYSTKILPITILSKLERAVNVKRMCLRQYKHFFPLRTNHDVHGGVTRNSDMLFIDSLNFVRNGNSSPFFNALTEYNRLPDDIRMCTTLETFRRKTSLHLLEEDSVFHPHSPFLYMN